MKRTVLLAAATLGCLSAGAVTPLWLRDVKISPDGSRIAFCYKGDIYTVPAGGGNASRLTVSDDYEANPVWSPDSRSIAFASDRNGNFDIYIIDAAGGTPRRLTYNSASEIPETFTPDGSAVMFSASIQDPAPSAMFPSGRMTELYSVSVKGDEAPVQVLATPARFVSWLPGGKSFLYQDVKGFEDEFRKHHTSSVTRDVWIYDTATRRHTNLTLRGGEDTNPVAGADGTFYFLSERNGSPVNVYAATLNDPKNARALTSFKTHPVRFLSRDNRGDLAFAYDGEIYTMAPGAQPVKVAIDLVDDSTPDIEKVAVRSGASEAVPSPDGKSLAFILDRHILAVMDLKSGKVRKLTDGSTYLQNDGRFNYTWSPDSKWIALEVIARKHDPYTDIAIINVADGSMTNLTNSGYFDAEPRFVMDGNAVAFASERYGMRNHASWGSMMDVMLVFLNQQAYDEYMLSKEDYALLKEARKNKDKNKDKDKDTDKDGDKDNSDSKDIKVELDGIADRTVRVTPMSVDLSDAIFTDDGEILYYIAEMPSGRQLWKYDRREDEHKMVTSLTGRAGFEATPDGKKIFLLGSTFRKLDPKTGKLTPIAYSATMQLNHDAEREFMFDNMAREEAARFYVADMHGVDWPAMTAHYRRFLPHINNNYDFAELLSELLGELNVSHTGGRYSHSDSQGDRTAALGLLYDVNHAADGMRVAEILPGGPFAKADTRVVPGTVVEYINGTQITPSVDISMLLTDQADKLTLVGLLDPATGERWEEVVKPISAGRQSALLYDRWVKGRAAAVDSLSHGRLGYVHIQSMDDESFRRVYSDILGKYNDREGIVIDVRWNGGGRLHEDIEVLFSGKKYFTQEIRGTESCDMPSRRWNKPSIMVMSEACYSNAHGTPWVYSHQGLGSLVGMPVPGTMTSVNWVRMQDPSLIFGIPVIGYRLPDRSFLENQQLEPDFTVANDPTDIVLGIDAQLETAVRELLRQIDDAK